MAKALKIEVKESVKELKALQKSQPSSHNKLQMLLLIKEGVIVSKDALASSLSVSNKSVHVWRTRYLSGGIGLLLEDNRGGKVGQITEEAHNKLGARLNNGSEGFKSYLEVQQWLKGNFGIEMEYHAVNKYVKRKFKARPKVARKSHVNKDPAAEAVFKKTILGTETY